MRLLIVEDEQVFAEPVSRVLRKAGYTVDIVDCLDDANSAIAVCDYNLILLDRHLPDGDGLDVLRALRRAKSGISVILMSAEMRSVHERIVGLEEGADDYMTKPLDISELLARVRALLRRPQELARSEVLVGNLCLNTETRSVSIDGAPVSISRRELGLLEHLVRAEGRVVLRDQIEQRTYGFDDEISINAIEVAIHRLRRRLEQHGAAVSIQTVRGLGYMLHAREMADV